MTEAQYTKSESGAQSGYYLGLWEWSNGGLNYLACAWREDGVWRCRCRFRYRIIMPRECRYTSPSTCTSDVEMNTFMTELVAAGNVDRRPIRYFPLNSGPERVFGIAKDLNLLERVLDDPALVVLYNQEALEVADRVLRYRDRLSDAVDGGISGNSWRSEARWKDIYRTHSPAGCSV